MNDDAYFAALKAARLPELISEQELNQRANRMRRRIRHLARRERVAALRRWWLAILAGFVLTMAGVGVVGASLLHRQPDHQDMVWCYRWVPSDLTDDSARFGVAFVGSGATSAQWALDLCNANDDGTMKPHPDEVSQCVLPDGNVAVIPISRCSDLGLPESEVRQSSTIPPTEVTE